MEASSSIGHSSRTSKAAPRLKRGLPRKLQTMSKEELLLNLQKKKECNAKALSIVEGMLERHVKEDWFLEMLQHINQSHLQDVIEERVITKICGYPLCSLDLKNVPSQQYCISTKLNKVYDITERKNFCSSKCFKACKFIKDQMYTSPLWLRDIEPSVKFVLMPSNKLSGGIGDEVNVQVERITREELKKLYCDEKKSPQKNSETTLSQQSCYDVDDNPGSASTIQESCNSSVNPFNEGAYVKHEDFKKSLVASCIESSSKVREKDLAYREGDEEDEKTENSETNTIADQLSGQRLKRKVQEDSSKGCTYKASLFNIADVPENSKSFEDSKPNSKKQALMLMSPAIPCPSEEELPCMKTDRDVSGSVSNQIEFGNETIQKSCSGHKSGECGYLDPPLFIEKKASKLQSCSREETGKQSLCEHIKKEETLLPPITKSKASHQSSNKKNNEKEWQTHSSVPNSLPIVFHVEKCVKEWFTIETMCYLYGETVLKEMLEQKGECLQKHYKALNSITWDQGKHERFMAICKRLNLLEIEDTSFDSKVMSDTEPKRQPLPDYESLRKEAELMELKIKAFYKGKLETDGKKVSFSEETKSNPEENNRDCDPQIPLVHLHSQRALRKKIVLDGLNRVLSDFLRTFGVRPSELTSAIRGLVGTFSLSPTNITFKPEEWSLLALIVIKLLSVREFELRQCLQQERSKTYLTLMLMSYKQEPGYLDQLMSWLTDIDNLLSR